MENLIETLTDIAVTFGFKILGAIATFVVGTWLAKAIQEFATKLMTRRKVETTLVTFVSNFLYFTIYAFVVLAALAQLGIQTTSFIAVLGAAGLAVGLALQGSLSNFAAGVLLILFRPFKVNDYIEGGGVAGTVQEIQIFTTTLISPDNVVIVVPNSNILGGNITNYTAKSMRRVDFVFGVGYTDDIDQVKTVIMDVLNQDERILKDPAPTVGILELADSSVNFAVRPWVMTADYWAVFFHINEMMKKRFDSEGISIPFPQQDVHMYTHPVSEA